jgi:hypothetical protein
MLKPLQPESKALFNSLCKNTGNIDSQDVDNQDNTVPPRMAVL